MKAVDRFDGAGEAGGEYGGLDGLASRSRRLVVAVAVYQCRWLVVVAVAGGADRGRRRRRLALPLTATMAVSVHISVHVGASVAATAVLGGKIGEEGQGGRDEDEEERACHMAWSNYHNVGELSRPEDVSGCQRQAEDLGNGEDVHPVPIRPTGCSRINGRLGHGVDDHRAVVRRVVER